MSLAPAVAPDLPLSPPLAGALLPDEPALEVAFGLAPELVFELALEVADALLEELLEEPAAF